jgi:hypothetical protein
MRPTASELVAPVSSGLREATQPVAANLTRAQAHALRRCAPLTPEQFKAKRILAAKGINPLRHD